MASGNDDIGKGKCPCGSRRMFKNCCLHAVKTVRPSPVQLPTGTVEDPMTPPPDLMRIAKAVGFQSGQLWSLVDIAERVDQLCALVDVVRQLHEKADDRGNVDMAEVEAVLPELWGELEKVDHPLLRVACDEGA
jgi:hypothetical protein